MSDILRDEPVLVAGIVTAIAALATHFGFALAGSTSALITAGVTIAVATIARRFTRPAAKSIATPVPVSAAPVPPAAEVAPPK